MSLSTIFSAAAVALLGSTASAATFNPASTQNVAVYWGQGNAQGPLSDVCADPKVDIVNIGFITQFPKALGEYPVTNFGNACWGWYDLPNGKDGTGYVVKHCTGVADAIKLCQKNGKKVLLSIGGGAEPADYYLPSEEVARYFGDWLWSAFGPPTAEWVNADKPRPFGDAVIDGFDLDIESGSRWDFYSVFVNNLKAKQQSLLFSAAPQCISPDPRLKEAIINAPFDFIFTQFYNTPECSARQGVKDLGKSSTKFTFDTWATWLHDNSQNKKVKLYLGLAAGTKGAGSAHPDHYLSPTEANRLITEYKGHARFGGVMLWEWTVSVNNKQFGRAYLDWIKYSLQGTFASMYKPMASSTIRTSTTITPTSTKPTSTKTTSATPTKSATPSPSKSATPSPSKSATPSPSKSATPSPSTSAIPSKSSTSASSVIGTLTPTTTAIGSSTIISTLTPVSTVSGSSVLSSASVVETYSESVVYSETFSAVHPSTVLPPIEPSSVYPSEVSSVYPSETPSASEILSTVHSSEASSVYPSETPSTSDIYPSETSSTSEVLSTVHASEASSVYPSETPSTDDSLSTVYPSETSSTVYPSEASSTVYPSEASSTVYPSETASEYSSSAVPTEVSTVYPGQNATSTLYPVQNATSTASEYSGYPTGTGVPSIVYPVDVSTVYPVDVSTVYPSNTEVYDSFVLLSSSTKTRSAYSTGSASCSTSGSATHVPAYPTTISSVQTPEASTKKPEYPADATTTIVTTTYVDVCPTGLTTKTAVVTQTVCSSCQKPEYPADWTTSVYVSSTLTVTITKPVHPETHVPAYPTGTPVAEYPAPKPSNVYGEDKQKTPEGEVPSYEAPSYEAPSYEAPSYETPSYETPSHEVPSHDTPKASSTSTMTVTLAQTPSPYAYTPQAHAPVAAPQASYPAGNGTEPVAPSGTGAASKPTSTGYPVIPGMQTPPEFEGAAGRVSVGLSMVVGVVVMLVL